MKALVEETCTGCGLCVQVCPEMFELNEQNIAIVKVTPVPPEVEETCREAVSGCPVEAIKLVE